MKKKILLALSTLFLLAAMTGCSNSQQSVEPEAEISSTAETTPEPEEPEIPPAVIDLQHKIDKALESEPSYRDLKEIKDAYEDLLRSEQDQIQSYHKIEKLLALSPKEVACIYTVNQLKDRLKNPLSLTLISANIVRDTKGDKSTIAVKIDYTASNSLGGESKSSYYCLLYTPQYDRDSQQWHCEMEEICAGQYLLEGLGESSSPSWAATVYETNGTIYKTATPVSVDVEKIMDNLELDITESIWSDKP